MMSMTDFMRVLSAPDGMQSLSRTESSLSVSSAPSRAEGGEDFLGFDSDEPYSTSTGDIQSTQDGGLWTGRVGSAECQRLPITMATSVLSHQEMLRQLHLRRHIEDLKTSVEEREQAVRENREQLIRCREHLDQLLAQRDSLEKKIVHHDRQEQEGGQVEEEEEGKISVASVGLFQSQLGKVRREIAAEEEVEKDIENKLQKAELALLEAQVAYGRFEEAEATLEVEEEVVREIKGRRAMQRLQGQTRMMVNAERSRKAQERLHQTSLMEQEDQMMVALEHARQAQQEGREFLRQTLDRRRKQEAAEGEKHRAHLEKRMKALLSLKNNIESSKGTIQAQQMLVHEKEKKRRKLEKAEKARIRAEGGNPDEVFLKRQRAEAFEKSREEFERKQRERQLEIVSQLLEERKIQKRLEAKLSKSHWHGKGQAPHPSKRRNLHLRKKQRVKHSVALEEGDVPAIDGEATAVDEADGKEEKRREIDLESSDEESHFGEQLQTGAMKTTSEESLAKPEIQGLWERSERKATLSGGRGGEGEGGGGKVGEGGVGKVESKAEREMREGVMEKLRKSVVVKQVAAGREFKGQAFLSKPAEVVFKDFEVGKVLRRRLQLTNVSYSVNYCKLLGVSEHLKDFITVDFNPPGSMSAGLTCHMSITFEPKLNEDLTGEIHFLSQTGPFSIPVKCLKKQCLISVEGREVDFGRVCIGETVTRHITLCNSGALATRFQFAAATISKPAIQVGSCVLPSSDKDSGGPLSEQSNLSIMSAVDATTTQLQGILVGGADGDCLKSRSMGDIASVSQKSLTWEDERGKQRPRNKVEKGEGEEKKEGEEKEGEEKIEGEERKGDGGGDDATGTIEEDVPGNQDHDISIVQSEVALDVQGTPAIQIGKVSEGEVGAYSSCSVELVFAPEVAASHSGEFLLTFSHPSLKPIPILARGQGIDLPVYVEREMMDLRICMLDRLYQDSIVVHNRSATALHTTFHLPPELRPHMEILPKHGLVQGESSFSAQLKFKPKSTIFTECSEFFNRGYLEVLVKIEVTNQTQPVSLTVYAQVTSSDIEFSTPNLDLGSCTVHESVAATIHLTNKSILPQQFGFINLPEFVEVQPGDGFGTLLPGEILPLDVIFSAGKPREYSFELTCKTGTDGTFKLPCHGTGILPSLELSENAINFAPTIVNNVRTARVSLHNPKLGRLNSAVIRGAILQQGPKAFEFIVPRGFPISVCPQVGVVPLGKSVDIQVQFTPRLDPEAIHQEALKLATTLTPQTQAPQTQSIEQLQEADQQPSPRKKMKQQPSRLGQKSSLHSSASSSSSQLKQQSSEGSKQPQALQQVEPPKEGSDLWWQAYSTLLNDSENQCLQLSIPCFVSSEAPQSDLDTLAYRPEDTLYLEVTAPIVRPGLAVVSDSGRTTTDFSNVGTGDTASRTVSVKNVSDSFLSLTSSLLDPHGPFEVCNALRDLPPGSSHNVLINFSPQAEGKYYESLKLYYGSHSSSLELKLTGTGVDPSVELIPKGDMCDMGHVMATDTTTKTLQLKNRSPLSVRYHAQLESLLVSSLNNRNEHSFRASNCNGQPVFNCVPYQGKIESGETQEITINFSPDHESPFYVDVLHIELNGQLSYSVHLKGRGWSNNMYVLDGETIGPREESMGAVISPPDDHPPPPKPLPLILVCHSGEEQNSPVTKEIQIGCIKTPLVKKNSGDFVIDPIPASNPNAKVFSIEPLKSSVEAGSLKTVTITFHPPRDSSVHTLEASTNLTVKGDKLQVYRLILRGLVCE